MVGVGSLLLGVDAGASEGGLGVVAEGVWCVSRGGSVEAAGAERGGGEVVGGAGLWGWGGMEEGLVGTAGLTNVDYNNSRSLAWHQHTISLVL